MARWLALCTLLALNGAPRAQIAGTPLTPPQKALLDQMAAYARDYEGRMPDFVCTRITKRSRDASGAGTRWQPLDTVEEELTFVKGHESYKLLKFNGKPVKPTAHVTSGFRSSGEFAGVLIGIFAAGTNAQFQWERDEDSGERHTSVFGFRVPREHSGYKVNQGTKRVVVGFGGLLYADAASGAVQRMHIDTDDPEGLAVGGMTTDVRFIDVTIAGQRYLLPGQAEARIRYKGGVLQREMEFRDYHKYVADAAVEFEPPK